MATSPVSGSSQEPLSFEEFVSNRTNLSTKFGGRLPIFLYRKVLDAEPFDLSDKNNLSRRKWEVLNALAEKYQKISQMYESVMGRTLIIFDGHNEKALEIIHKVAEKYVEGASIDGLVNDEIEKELNRHREDYTRRKEDVYDRIRDNLSREDAETLIQDYEDAFNAQLRAVPLGTPLTPIHFSKLFQNRLDLLYQRLEEFHGRLEAHYCHSNRLIQENAYYLDALMDAVVFVLEYPVNNFECYLQISHLHLVKTSYLHYPNWQDRANSLKIKLSRELGCNPQEIEKILQETCQEVKSSVQALIDCTDISQFKPLVPAIAIKKAFEAKKRVLALVCKPKECEEKNKLLDNHQTQILGKLVSLGLQSQCENILNFADKLRRAYSFSDPYHHHRAKQTLQFIILSFGFQFNQLQKNKPNPDLPSFPPPVEIPRSDLQSVRNYVTLSSHWVSSQHASTLPWQHVKNTDYVIIFSQLNVDPKRRDQLIKEIHKIIDFHAWSLNYSPVATTQVHDARYVRMPCPSEIESVLNDFHHVVALWNAPSCLNLKTLHRHTRLTSFTFYTKDSSHTASFPLSIILGYAGRLIVKQEAAVGDIVKVMDETFKMVCDDIENAKTTTTPSRYLFYLKALDKWLDSTVVKLALSSTFLFRKMVIDSFLESLEKSDKREASKKSREELEEELKQLLKRYESLKRQKKDIPESADQLDFQLGLLNANNPAQNQSAIQQIEGKLVIITEYERTQVDILRCKRNIYACSHELPSIGKVYAEIIRTLINNHGYEWVVELINDFRPLLHAMAKALEKVESSNKSGITQEDREKIFNKYLAFRTRLAKTLTDLIKKAKANPLEARVLEILKKHMGTLQINWFDQNFTQRFFDKVIEPAILEFLNLPNDFFPKVRSRWY